MTSETPAPARDPDPRGAYTVRLAARRALLAGIRTWDDRVVAGRLAAVVAGAVAIWRPELRGYLAAPVLVFLVLVFVHEQVLRRVRRAERSVRHYEARIARVDGRLPDRGDRGERLRDPAHPCAEDLDLFGAGSLFERVCTCRTRIGEDALAGLLLAPVAASVARERQEAVRDMAARLDLREDLEVDGEGLRTRAGIAQLRLWAAAEPPPGRVPSRAVAVLFSLLTTTAIVAWATELGGSLSILAAIAAQSAYAYRCRGWVDPVLASVEAPARELGLLAIVMRRLEREPFGAAQLTVLVARLASEGPEASEAVARLARAVDRLEWARNPAFAPFAALLSWRLHHARAIEDWRERHGGDVGPWIEATGMLEAMASLGGYAHDRPAEPYPEIADGGPLLEATALAHPLLAPEVRVANDVALGSGRALLLVSGSNMSGKSTFLRAIGTNVVLAMAGAPVAAASMRLSPLLVGATLRTQDSLAAGQSRFYAEISRIRQVLSACDGPFPVLFLLDEILHGTNSHDRRVGAEAIIGAFVARGAVGLVTTHDLALAVIPEGLGERAANVHFEDRLSEGKMTFDYRLRPGVVEHSNALALMRAVGLPV